MTVPDLSPAEGVRWALRAGVPLEAARHDMVVATANHIHGVIKTLRNLDLAETVPAATYRAVRSEDGTKEADRAAV